VTSLPAAVEIEDVGCPHGCPRGEQPLFSGRDRLHGLPGEFAVVRCRTCGLMRTNPRPTRATIGFYYPSDYRVHQAAGSPAPAGRARGRRLLQRLFDFRSTSLPELGAGHLYEVGCGNGAFLRRMAERGWSVEGLEPSRTAAENARALGLRVQHAPLEAAGPPQRPPDLVVAWMVLEHLHDPIEGLVRLHGWTRPGAWLAASVPNAASLEFAWFRDAWYSLHLPAHLFFFTPQTLERLLRASGWRLERVLHQRNLLNLVASTGYRLRDRGVWPRLADRLASYPQRARWQHYAGYPLAAALAAFGQTGRMTFWARRG
jgi:SAM-dependent methyltransferase